MLDIKSLRKAKVRVKVLLWMMSMAGVVWLKKEGKLKPTNHYLHFTTYHYPELRLRSVPAAGKQHQHHCTMTQHSAARNRV